MRDWEKVYRAILTSKPRTHSYGFAQIYLAEKVRLHLFDQIICEKACIPEQVPVRHNHRYDFKSTVLSGIVIDKPCLIVPATSILYTDEEPWTVHEVRPAHERINERPREVSHGDLWKDGSVKSTDNKVYVVERTPRVIRAGESYSMTSEEFHETQHVGRTVSVFKRDNIRPEWSKLVVPPGYTAEHSMSKQPDAEWLEEQFLDATYNLPAWAHARIVEEAGL